MIPLRTLCRPLNLIIGLCVLQLTAVNSQIFTPGHLAVLRVGNGTQALTSSGNSVFIDQYTEAGTLVNVNVLPDTGAQAVLLSGTSSSEGGLTRSLDFSQLVFAGYNTNRGSLASSLSSQSGAVVPRAVATLDAFINYQLFTGGPTLYSSNNIRGAAGDGANSFWTAGSPGGTFYLNPPQAPVEIQAANANTRQVKIVGSNLYFSTQAGTAGIYTFQGGGLPKSADNTVLVFGTGANGQPAGFALNLALTTAYVADQRATAGGIQKWTNNGSAWSLAYSFSTGAGAFDVVADFSGAAPILYATTAEASANRLISITDNGPLSMVKVLATAVANEVFRGLDFAPDLRPVVVAQPQTQTVTNGSDVTFSVSVQSKYPVSYQWQKNSTNLSGANAAVLTLQNVSLANQGSYRVVATNLYGSVVSAAASLTVNQVLNPPTITTQPAGQTVALGGSATLTVVATGTPPLTYQWLFNGASLQSQTNSILNLPNVAQSSQGSYMVIVTNPAGSTNSQPATLSVTVPPPSSFGYAVAGSIYSQNFNSLPNSGTTSVNADNPVKIGASTYGLANPFDFTFPILPNSVNPNTGVGLGGLGLSNTMPGWYALGETASKFGSSAGDQSTGGAISFGLTNSLNASTNRALGLLSTSSTGPTAFGLKLINQTAATLNQISVHFTGELWRQAAVSKSIAVAYWLDSSATNAFSTNVTSLLPALNVVFAADPAATNPVPVDGTSPVNQLSVGVANQAIADWPPGAALWLSWRMTDPAGKGQGIAIDDLVFSAGVSPTSGQPQLSIRQSGSSVVVSWPSSFSTYQLQATSAPSVANSWSMVPQPVIVNNGSNTVTIPLAQSDQFYRLKQ
jgi:hypothetical protein